MTGSNPSVLGRSRPGSRRCQRSGLRGRPRRRAGRGGPVRTGERGAERPGRLCTTAMLRYMPGERPGARYLDGHAACPPLVLYRLRSAPLQSFARRRVRTAPRTACVGGFYGPGRPPSPDAVTRGAPYGCPMAVTTKTDYRAKSLTVERSARTKRRAVPRVRPKDSAGHQHAIAGPSHVAGTSSPDRGTKPPFWWQGVGATYDYLPSASKRLRKAEPKS